MMSEIHYLEDKVLQAVDAVAEQADNRVMRQLVDLFKSAILKKYKEVYDRELASGKVNSKYLNKAVDFCFSEACITYRQMQINGVSEERKEEEIKKLKPMLGTVKDIVKNVLEKNGVVVL